MMIQSNKNNQTEVKTLKKILFITMFSCIIIIFIFSFVIYNEINSAKKECNNIDGNYKLKNFQHECNNKSFYKYSDGNWGFDNTFYWNSTEEWKPVK